MTDLQMLGGFCRVDEQPNHWFRCAHGTVGCPRIHDGRTPHCIACAAGTPCSYHAEPVLEMSADEYYAAANPKRESPPLASPGQAQLDTEVNG